MMHLAHKSVADAGCGIGHLCRTLAKRAGSVVGMDADEDLVRAATEASAGFGNLAFVHGDPVALGFTERFDAVFSTYSAAYCVDLGQALEAYTKMLKVDGLLVVLEVDGVFSMHSPLFEHAQWFADFDADGLASLGFDAFAGGKLGPAALQIEKLQRPRILEWQDRELSFDGPAAADVLEAWEKRWARLAPAMVAYGAGDIAEKKESFFACLSNPKHTSKKLKLLIARKRKESAIITQRQKDEAKAADDEDF